MELIIALLTQLSTALSDPTTFILIMLLVCTCTFFGVKFVIKQSSGKNKFWSSIFKDNSNYSKEFDDIKSQLSILIDSHSESVTQLINIIQQLRDDSNEAIQAQVDEYAILKRDIETVKNELIRDIDDMKQWFKISDLNDQQMNSNIKEMFQRIFDMMLKINNQIEKIDDFVHDVVPEFRSDHREINKEITELSKDIALIERTIQTQVNSNTVKLK